MDLKAILLHSKSHNEGHFEIVVPLSRYRKILSDFHALKSINLDTYFDFYIDNYKYYTLNIDNNFYKVIVDRTIKEEKGKCSQCNCTKKRWINSKTGVCYYNEMIQNDYTTKIK